MAQPPVGGRCTLGLLEPPEWYVREYCIFGDAYCRGTGTPRRNYTLYLGPLCSSPPGLEGCLGESVCIRNDRCAPAPIKRSYSTYEYVVAGRDACHCDYVRRINQWPKDPRRTLILSDAADLHRALLGVRLRPDIKIAGTTREALRMWFYPEDF